MVLMVMTTMAVVLGIGGLCAMAVNTNPKLEEATFAGGCFWCMEPPFAQLPGVVTVESGYAGGSGTDPTYHDHAAKGHREVIRITYDPAVISYGKLLDVFWRQIDPTDPGGQFVDRGPSYRSAIFVRTPEQRKLAESSKEALARSGRFNKPIVTEILDAGPFYRAEAYHQDYANKNPLKYKQYRHNSGRDQFLERVWGASRHHSYPAGQGFCPLPRGELKDKLTPLQYQVTQENGTEPPFRNEYWDNKRPGIYVDIVSGEPLFASTDKFDSGTGWPSFTKPLEPGNIVEKQDRSLFMVRTEVRSRQGNSHLGHVFNDGPPPTGRRYCINSAALRFIPQEDLEKEGLGKYLKLFEPPQTKK